MSYNLLLILYEVLFLPPLQTHIKGDSQRRKKTDKHNKLRA